MMNSDSTHTVDTRPFMGHVERRLVGPAMIITAYLIEKAMLGSIRRSNAKSSLQDRTTWYPRSSSPPSQHTDGQATGDDLECDGTHATTTIDMTVSLLAKTPLAAFHEIG